MSSYISELFLCDWRRGKARNDERGFWLTLLHSIQWMSLWIAQFDGLWMQQIADPSTCSDLAWIKIQFCSSGFEQLLKLPINARMHKLRELTARCLSVKCQSTFKLNFIFPPNCRRFTEQSITQRFYDFIKVELWVMSRVSRFRWDVELYPPLPAQWRWSFIYLFVLRSIKQSITN